MYYIYSPVTRVSRPDHACIFKTHDTFLGHYFFEGELRKYTKNK